jgi:Leucine-rich repeat (LRR) protein
MLKFLPSLESLVLQDTNIDNHAIFELKHLTNLKELDLRGTRLKGDGGLAAITPFLPHLRHLSLSGTAVDDRCIAPLASLPKLQFLYIHGTQVTAAGLRKVVDLRKQGSLQWLAGLTVNPHQLPEQLHLELDELLANSGELRDSDITIIDEPAPAGRAQ